MNQTAIFWPMLAQVALIYLCYALLGLRRRRAVLEGEAEASQFRENRVEPPLSLPVRNNLANQFELPMLFFAVGLGLHAIAAVDRVAIALAWLFVVSRWLHFAVHVTSNDLRWRSPAFAFGFVILGVMWALLALRLLEGG